MVIAEKGMIFTERTACKDFLCSVCGLVIDKGLRYYEVVKGGGGLSWRKNPDRIHLEEREQFHETNNPWVTL